MRRLNMNTNSLPLIKHTATPRQAVHHFRFEKKLRDFFFNILLFMIIAAPEQASYLICIQSISLQS